MHSDIQIIPLRKRCADVLGIRLALNALLLAAGAILNYLFEHCTRPEFQVRFRWRPHSVTFWDNRSVQHMALWDYYPQVRSGRRVTIKGDRPF